jgi:hypothetical protein
MTVTVPISLLSNYAISRLFNYGRMSKGTIDERQERQRLLTAGALGAALVAVLLPTDCGAASSPVVGPPATSAPITMPGD